MEKILVNVPYLEGNDVNSDGSIKSYVCKGKKLLMMVQGNFCGYCTKAKPDFQKLANNGRFNIATVQIDGGKSDSEASQKLSAVNKARGVPAYLCFNENGKYIASHEGGRDGNALAEFMSKN